MSAVRFGTIGTGWIVDSFLEGAALTPGLRHAAVCSRSEETGRRFAEKHGVYTVYTDVEEMAKSAHIDACYVASPNGLHERQCRILLENGKHVLCEKPAGASGREVRALLDTAARKGVVFMEALIPLHLPRIEILAQQVKKLGRISLARFDFSQYSSKYPAYLAGELPNIFNPRFCTGALMDLGIYCVFPALYLFGRPLAVSASASFLESGADGAGCAVLDYGEMQAVLTYSKTGHSRTGSEIIGSLGTLTLSSVSKMETMRMIDLKGDVHSLFGIEDKNRQMAYEAEDFYGCITDMTRYASRYASWSRMSRDIADVLDEIRRAAGIRFPRDEENPIPGNDTSVAGG